MTQSRVEKYNILRKDWKDRNLIKIFLRSFFFFFSNPSRIRPRLQIQRVNCRFVLRVGGEVRTQRGRRSGRGEQIAIGKVGGGGGAEDRPIRLGWPIRETIAPRLSSASLVRQSFQRCPPLDGSGRPRSRERAQ